jgi:hypothetical protein
MKLGRWSHVGVSAGTLGALAMVGTVFAACSSSSTAPPNNTGDSGSAPLCGLSDQAGTQPPAAGTFPAPNCSTLAPGSSCVAGQNICPVTDPKCGPNTACLAFADNSTSPTSDFRIRRLTVVAPANLASTFLQGDVVTPAIELPNKECAESGAPGKGGLFNWIIRVDKTAGTLTTGGAPPSADPFGTGYCFMNTTVAGHTIAPISGPLAFSGSTFTSTPAANTLFVPIFTAPPATPLDPSTLVLLPIQGGTLNSVTISPDGNCIGSYNPAGPSDATCGDDPSSCSKWNTAGSIGGFITISDADTVVVALNQKTLCAILTGKSGPPDASGIGHCLTDGSAKGDYCSQTKAPGGCQDSFWLTATFAASAVKINDGTGNALCTGSGVSDAGSDTGSDAPAE